jgi:16S rRNA (cytidine1402-2'-O)-methyltransferase
MLYFVPTPIGNLGDITLRATQLLTTAKIIITEDSRQTRKLLDLLNIENKPQFVDIVRNHNLNRDGIQKTLAFLQVNPEAEVLLMTDAGTPGISDPGREVIHMSQAMGVKYTILPGANAVIPAVVASGLVSKEFLFIGFLPIKKGRQQTWQEIIRSQYPCVIYESVHRIQKLINEITENLELERKVCICKDISKLYEKIWFGSVQELRKFELVEKGEFVLVIDKAVKVKV